MVSHLADNLVGRYANDAKRLLDPFCGSGAVLLSAQRRGIPVSGIDLNPVAALFSKVKLSGFCQSEAARLAGKLVGSAKKNGHTMPVHWEAKHYWFTAGALAKFERLRAACCDLGLDQSADGTAVLLALALSVRLCSRADQRSPKPFISKQATLMRRGLHFDPYKLIPSLLEELSEFYGTNLPRTNWNFVLSDIVCDTGLPKRIGKHSHVITSPPYINAQDYFRNFKLELHCLEGVLPFSVANVKERFIGTDRGSLLLDIPDEEMKRQRDHLPQLVALGRKSPRSAAIVHRYLYDMGKAFDNIKKCLEKNGTFVLVCGDNLIAGKRIRTWQVLTDMLTERDFELFDSFTDPIGDRLLAPKRCGHKGLIKEEVIQAFRLN